MAINDEKPCSTCLFKLNFQLIPGSRISDFGLPDPSLVQNNLTKKDFIRTSGIKVYASCFKLQCEIKLVEVTVFESIGNKIETTIFDTDVLMRKVDLQDFNFTSE